MTLYRVAGIDFGEPTLPDAALAGKSVGDIVDLTLSPTVESILLDAGVLELFTTAGVAVANVVVTADNTATINATPYPTGSLVFQVTSLSGSPLNLLSIFVI